MPTAKPRYDGGSGDWKSRTYSEAEWEDISERIRKKLSRFYPDKNAKADPPFAHPADAWANHLLAESQDVLSTTQVILRRLTNEELRAELKVLLSTLNKANKCLSSLSRDVVIALGDDANILVFRDRIRNFIPHVEAAKVTITKLPRAKKIRDVQHDAAVEMAVRVLRVLNEGCVSTAVTADTDLDYISAVVQILKIIGDEIGLVLAETTWKSIINEARLSLPPRQ